MNKIFLIILGLVLIACIITVLLFFKKDNNINESPDINKMSDNNRDIANASEKFKAQQYFRYEEAKKLVPQLKIGMTKQDIKSILGKPNIKDNNDLLWRYTLGYSQFISVSFDSNDIVNKFGGAYDFLKKEI